MPDNGDVDAHPYLAGLVLTGRRVVVVGGGHVAQRRVPTFLAAGARVTVVSPEVTPAIEGLAGELTLELREFDEPDLDGAWYVVAATDDPAVNARVAAAAEARHTFCVRADDARGGTAWTPAVGHHGSVTVGVLGNREPRKSAALRDDIVTALRDGHLNASDAHDRSPGVVLVGGGPGDPELVTVAARHALASADVVVADRLAPRELLDGLGSHVELIDVAKLPRGRSASQDLINEVIVARALAGKRVVRFKGGDNFVFGRGYEEIQACAAAGVPVTVVPGLTSAIAVPALVGIPVTHRGVAHDFTVISGHLPPGHPELAGRLAVGRRPARHGRAADGRGQRAGDREGAPRRRSSGRHPGGGDRRRHDAHRAHRAHHAGFAGRRPGRARGGAPGDHRGR